MPKAKDADVLVIGGGFYGAMLAAELSARIRGQVVLVEASPELLSHASYNNQARVHGGYHYPRSVLTARRSRANAPRFIREFADCIDAGFTKLYAIARRRSSVSAAQFRRFADAIGAPIRPAAPDACALVDQSAIEAVFEVDEPAFDAGRLRARMEERLASAGVSVLCNTTAERVSPLVGGGLQVSLEGEHGGALNADVVYNCTYSRLNRLLIQSGAAPLPLTHELTELALVRPPEELAAIGITVMCGPFFSCMPFPPRGLHSLSHVRYTPHREWRDADGSPYLDSAQIRESAARRTRFDEMRRDAARYVPLLARASYVESLWEVKTVLPRSEGDDSRPILVHEVAELPGLHCVMGSKIDNVYDMLDIVLQHHEQATP